MGTGYFRWLGTESVWRGCKSIATIAALVVSFVVYTTPATAGASANPKAPTVRKINVPVDAEATQARISFTGGAGMIKGNGDTDWAYTTLNTLVLPGNSLWADKEGAMEVEIAGGSYLRMADTSKAQVVSLLPTIQLKGEIGSFYVQRTRESTGDVTFVLPIGQVVIRPNSEVRIDILGSGATTVSDRWGDAVIKTENGGDTSITQGERSYIDPGYLPSAPTPFDRGQEDAFDTWNRERSRTLAANIDRMPATAGITADTVGAGDLSEYGNWVTIDGNSYWQPSVGDDFVPYRDGYWSYVPGCGYVWVGSDPFSYVTSHYGRWWYEPDTYGWLWAYDDVWCPAWVAPVQCGSYFAWCPLDPFGYPCAGIDNSCIVGGLAFGVRWSSYCDIDDLRFGRCRVLPCDRSIFTDGRTAGFFNINERGHDSFVRFRDPGFGVRGVEPNRIIRGRETLASMGEPARVRAASLERTAAPVRALAMAKSAHQGVQTLTATRASNVLPRTASVSPAILSHTAASATRTPGRGLMRTSSGSVVPNVRGAGPRSAGTDMTVPHAATVAPSRRTPPLASGPPPQSGAMRELSATTPPRTNRETVIGPVGAAAHGTASSERSPSSPAERIAVVRGRGTFSAPGYMPSMPAPRYTPPMPAPRYAPSMPAPAPSMSAPRSAPSMSPSFSQGGGAFSQGGGSFSRGSGSFARSSSFGMGGGSFGGGGRGIGNRR